MFKNGELITGYDYRKTTKRYFNKLPAKELLDIIIEIKEKIKLEKEVAFFYLVPKYRIGAVFAPISYAAGKTKTKQEKCLGH